jgi:hypothetical protein
MKRTIIREFTVFFVCFFIADFPIILFAQDIQTSEIVPQLDRKKLPGRQVKVAAISIGFGGQHDVKLKLAIEHLHTAGKNGVDIACLPEEFAGTKAEPVPGPTTRAVAILAKKYNMYVICPIREQAGDKQYNTAVLIDRKGKIAGYYRKVFVFWGEGLHVSTEGLYHYYIVPVGAGNIIDITGKTFDKIEKPRPKQFIATLDLDRAFAHYDFNRKKVEKMLAEHKGEIKVERELSDEDLAPWWLFKAVKPGVSVRKLIKKYKIETLREYQHRSREQINKARKKGERI